MGNNLLQFPNSANQNKNCSSPKTVRIMIILMILLLAVKIFHLDDVRPEIYRRHDVVMIKDTVKIPEDYMVFDLAGKQLRLTDLLGEDITILAFWATWCGYCAKEFPQIDALDRDLSSHGVKVLPIARGDDTVEKINQFFKRGNIKNMESVIASNPFLYKQLEVMGYPTFIAVDKNGLAFAKLRPKWEDNDIANLFVKLQQNKYKTYNHY